MTSQNVSYYGLFFGGPWNGRGIPMSHVRPVFDVLLPPKDIIAVSAEDLVPEPTWQIIRYQISGQVKARDQGKVRIYTIYEPGNDNKRKRRKLRAVLHHGTYVMMCEDVVEWIEIEKRYAVERGEPFQFEVPWEG